jgi:hypothetical protein
MSCPLRRREGSGYVKPTDTGLSRANEDALAKLRAERAQLDARLAAAYATEEPAKAEGEKKPTTPRFKMTGD